MIPLVSRHVHSSGYGQLATVAGLILIAAIVTEGGLGTVGIREYSNLSGDERHAFMRSLLGLRVALSAIGALVAFGFAVVAGYPRVEVEGTAIAAVGLVVANVQATLSIPLTAGLRLKWVAAIDLAGPAANAVVMVALVLVDAPFLLFFAGPLAAGLVMLVLTAVAVRAGTRCSRASPRGVGGSCCGRRSSMPPPARSQRSTSASCSSRCRYSPPTTRRARWLSACSGSRSVASTC